MSKRAQAKVDSVSMSVGANLVPGAHVSFAQRQKTRGLWERDWCRSCLAGLSRPAQVYRFGYIHEHDLNFFIFLNGGRLTRIV